MLRALAQGAKSVLIGRPTIWGLAAGGAGGVARVLRRLHGELAEVMAITGARSVDSVDRSVMGIRPAQFSWSRGRARAAIRFYLRNAHAYMLISAVSVSCGCNIAIAPSCPVRFSASVM